MTPEAQRIAIAEWCGHVAEWWCPTCREWIPPERVTYAERHDDRADGCGNELTKTPDYLNDLNAIHELEEKLDGVGGGWNDYIVNLHGAMRTASAWKLCHATAAQRAEALLRTIGKWRDE